MINVTHIWKLITNDRQNRNKLHLNQIYALVMDPLKCTLKITIDCT